MGNCVSASNRQDSALKLGLSVGQHKAGDRPAVAIESPVKRTAVGVRSSVAELGTKEEFFDSKPWLDSDCEDYFSVCDDTPSYGNSPIHSKNFGEPLFPGKYPSKEAAPNCVTEPPEADLKKQLHELFDESFRANLADDKLGFLVLSTDSPDKSPYGPVIISDQAPGSIKKVKSTQSPHCCIPSLARNFSFGERKKRMKPVNGSVV